MNAVAFSASGTLQSINFQANGTPATTQTFLILSGTAPSLTIAASFTATVAATSNPQVLVAGVNFVAPTVTAGEFLGNWVSSGTSVGYASSGVNGVYYLTGQVSLPGGAQTYGSATGSYAILGAVVTPSLATPRQAGFDNTNNANYSAEFPYNQWNVAPNNALSTIDWNSPWTMMLHVDRFNWDHAAPIYLASKGDLNSAAVNNNWWALFVQPNTGNSNTSQLCFARNGLAPDTAPNTGGTFVVNQRWCTALYIDMMPNSFNYNIIVEDSGTGGGNALSVWLNGIAMPLVVTASGNGFGGVTTAVTSGGSGYPTGGVAYSSTGGGANCLVTGTANVTSGVVTSTTNQTDQGCTSAPTIGLVASSGSGAVIAATAYPMTMNSTSAPLMVPGYKINGTEYGPGGTDTAQSPLYVDEFAEFPGNLSFGQITNIFYETKFYQGLLYSGLRASPPLVILGGFGCGPDFSGDQTLAMTIGAHQAGLIRLIGVVDDDGNANGSNSVGWWREMLDQAGLNDVPLSVGGGSQTSNVGGCPTANITGYNASTPQNASSYESALTMYRTLFARYPSAPIYVLMTQTANGYNNFQLSPADGISPLTGLQLQTRNYANGGWINGFQGNLNLTPSSYASVWTNMGTGPVYMWGGSPASGGPGVLVSRTATDPLYLTATLAGAPADVVAGWTNLNLEHHKVYLSRGRPCMQCDGADGGDKRCSKRDVEGLGSGACGHLRRHRLWMHSGIVYCYGKRDEPDGIGSGAGFYHGRRHDCWNRDSYGHNDCLAGQRDPRRSRGLCYEWGNNSVHVDRDAYADYRAHFSHRNGGGLCGDEWDVCTELWGDRDGSIYCLSESVGATEQSDRSQRACLHVVSEQPDGSADNGSSAALLSGAAAVERNRGRSSTTAEHFGEDRRIGGRQRE